MKLRLYFDLIMEVESDGKSVYKKAICKDKKQRDIIIYNFTRENLDITSLHDRKWLHQFDHANYDVYYKTTSAEILELEPDEKDKGLVWGWAEKPGFHKDIHINYH